MRCIFWRITDLPSLKICEGAATPHAGIFAARCDSVHDNSDVYARSCYAVVSSIEELLVTLEVYLNRVRVRCTLYKFRLSKDWFLRTIGTSRYVWSSAYDCELTVGLCQYCVGFAIWVWVYSITAIELTICVDWYALFLIRRSWRDSIVRCG